MRRLSLLVVAVLLLAVQGGPPVKFIHPKTRIVLASVRGFADIPVQVWAERHEANRLMRVEWWGEGCSGSFEREMAGEGAPRLFPDDGWRLARLQPGVCLFTASVYGAGSRLRHRATLEVCAAGGEHTC